MKTLAHPFGTFLPRFYLGSKNSMLTFLAVTTSLTVFKPVMLSSVKLSSVKLSSV